MIIWKSNYTSENDLFSDSWSTTIWKFIDDNNTLDNCELFDSNSNKNYLFLKLISQEKEKDNNEEILNMPDNDNMEKSLNIKEEKDKENNNNNENDLFKNNNEKMVTFGYKFNNNRKPKTVLVSGSFDNWKEKHPLKYDNKERKWICHMNLKKGKYFYKYIIDGNWEINPNENQMRGNDGIVNNVIDV